MTIIATYYDKSDKEFEIQKNDDCNGTHLQGYINVSYSSLVGAFGNPQYFASGDGKVQCEWNLLINGEVVTIYDWKEGGKPVQNISEWHIGGYSKKAEKAVLGAFQAWRNSRVNSH